MRVIITMTIANIILWCLIMLTLILIAQSVISFITWENYYSYTIWEWSTLGRFYTVIIGVWVGWFVVRL